MELTPEERRRIYEEEKARIQAERRARGEARPRSFSAPLNLAIVLAALVLAVVIARLPTYMQGRKPSSSASSHAGSPAAMQETVEQVLPGPWAGQTSINPVDGAKMVAVPAGEFMRGSTDDEIARVVSISPEYTQASWCDSEKPQQSIYLDGYWIYKYEVTVAQYRKFCKATGGAMPDPPSIGWRDDRPVTGVTWQDAADYAKWAGASLPTEAQWEKAARGTDGRIYPWGSSWDASRCANSVKRELDGPSAVGRYPKGVSPYGCYDMAGNAMEWCADWYDEDETYYATAPASNPKGPLEGTSRVLRGGSWDYYSASPLVFRCAARGGADPDKGDLSGSQGFRCAKMP